jgi:hypothetical protein
LACSSARGSGTQVQRGASETPPSAAAPGRLDWSWADVTGSHHPFSLPFVTGSDTPPPSFVRQQQPESSSESTHHHHHHAVVTRHTVRATPRPPPTGGRSHSPHPKSLTSTPRTGSPSVGPQRVSDLHARRAASGAARDPFDFPPPLASSCSSSRARATPRPSSNESPAAERIICWF